MPFTNALEGAFSYSYAPLLDQDAHFYARLWEIRRTDGVTHRFTDVGENVEFLGFTFYAAIDPLEENGIAPSPTARQRKDALGAGDMQLSGAMSVAGITEADLKAGKLFDAVVLERIVDRRFPWGGVFDTQESIVADVEYDSETHVLQCESLSSRFKTSFGELYSYECPHELGDQTPGRCGVDLTATNRTVLGTISAVDNRRTFTVAATYTAVHLDGWFARGKIEFTDNPALTGQVYTVANNEDAAAGIMRLTLAHTLPSAAVIGNTVTLIVGCVKNEPACSDKFDNLDNFGADPFIPGVDRTIRTPSLTK
jgi:uncharacterized phage protein (TIGR02218 family)